jgi:hypothetical protein
MEQFKSMSTGPTKHLARLYEAKLDFGGMLIQLKHTGFCEIHGAIPLTPSELACLAIISDMLKSLREGRDVLEYNIDPGQLVRNEVITCDWSSNGYLRKRADKPTRLYMHATTFQEAMTRRGSFTTTMAVFQLLPARRTPEQVAAFLKLMGDGKLVLPTDNTRPPEEDD